MYTLQILFLSHDAIPYMNCRGLIFGAVVFALCISSMAASAEKPTFVDGVTFTQYSDDAIALADVAAKRLDIHYGGLSAELIDQSIENVQIYESQSGSYSLLVNPAVSDAFNVFDDRNARYALNYIVDRSLVVNEFLGGYGVAMSLAYPPYDPDYVALAEAGIPEFAYDPALAKRLITESLVRKGATLQDGSWMYDGKSVTVTIFIRSDDLVRKSIGELIVLELSRIGLQVERVYGDLNKAFVVVYGTDPAKLQWSIYTEGWGGKSGFVRYDPVILAQMYSPWFSSMPGFNDPSYWNYHNPEIDELTRAIYSGGFADRAERDELVWRAANMGVAEAVRVFLAADYDLYAVGSDVDGIVNDFGAGVPSRFTPINAQTPSGQLKIGVNQIYQGAWNPVMGFADTYSSRIWSTLADPAVFRHPYNGSPMPVRATWSVQNNGPDDSIDVPSSALLWNATSQLWQGAPPGTVATSSVTFDLALSEWHHGEMMDMYDIMYAVYFASEWASQRSTDDRTFDAEYASRVVQFISTLRGVEPLDDHRVRVYVDYWNFDEPEIAEWASVWTVMPWELYAGMERTVSFGDASFSRSGAGASGVPWLSLVIESDAKLVSRHITELRDADSLPLALEQLGADAAYAAHRYDSTLEWIADYDHAVISNGPFYLVGYSPESRTIKTASFDNPSYPFAKGHWRSLSDVVLARITGIEVPRTHPSGTTLSIPVTTESATKLYYLVSPTGKTPLVSGILNATSGASTITVPSSVTSEFGAGTLTLALYATSDDVLRPDIFSTSFVVTPNDIQLPDIIPSVESIEDDSQDNGAIFAIIILGSALVGMVVLWRSRSARFYARNK